MYSLYKKGCCFKIVIIIYYYVTDRYSLKSILIIDNKKNFIIYRIHFISCIVKRYFVRHEIQVFHEDKKYFRLKKNNYVINIQQGNKCTRYWILSLETDNNNFRKQPRKLLQIKRDQVYIYHIFLSIVTIVLIINLIYVRDTIAPLCHV